MVFNVWLTPVLALLLAAVMVYLVYRAARNTSLDSEGEPIKAAPAARGTQSFGGAGLSLTAPPGFEVASTWEGFGQAETGASVMAVRVPGPFADIEAGFSDVGLASRGMQLVSREARTHDGLPAVLLRATQTAQGTRFDKWLLAFGDAEQTFLVTATWPEDEALSAPLQACVLSARRDAPPAMADTVTQAAADLPFSVTPGGGLALAASLGKSQVFTRDGAPASSASDPLFVVSPSLGPASIGDRNGFARQRIQQIEQVRSVTITAQAPLRIDDLDGIEIVGRGTDAKTGAPLTVYQAVLFDGDHYFLMQGMVGADEQRTYLPVFKTLARTFRRTPAH